jgi:hypothetical protein
MEEHSFSHVLACSSLWQKGIWEKIWLKHKFRNIPKYMDKSKDFRARKSVEKEMISPNCVLMREH